MGTPVARRARGRPGYSPDQPEKGRRKQVRRTAGAQRELVVAGRREAVSRRSPGGAGVSLRAGTSIRPNGHFGSWLCENVEQAREMGFRLNCGNFCVNEINDLEGSKLRAPHRFAQETGKIGVFTQAGSQARVRRRVHEGLLAGVLPTNPPSRRCVRVSLTILTLFFVFHLWAPRKMPCVG